MVVRGLKQERLLSSEGLHVGEWQAMLSHKSVTMSKTEKFLLMARCQIFAVDIHLSKDFFTVLESCYIQN